MKTKYLSLLLAVLGGSLSFGASVNGLNPAYSKDHTVYNGSNGDTLNVSSPTTAPVHTNTGATPWTMSFTISDLSATTGTDVGLLFTNNTIKPYMNLEGKGFQLTDSGDLPLCAGNFNYNGGAANTSPLENDHASRLFRRTGPHPVLRLQRWKCHHFHHARQ